MNKSRGFTLIELLVVIAIIALLMAVLMPSLQRVRRQAKTVACQAQLHQWALVFSAYTSDYDGNFMQYILVLIKDKSTLPHNITTNN